MKSAINMEGRTVRASTQVKLLLRNFGSPDKRSKPSRLPSSFIGRRFLCALCLQFTANFAVFYHSLHRKNCLLTFQVKAFDRQPYEKKETKKVRRRNKLPANPISYRPNAFVKARGNDAYFFNFKS